MKKILYITLTILGFILFFIFLIYFLNLDKLIYPIIAQDQSEKYKNIENDENVYKCFALPNEKSIFYIKKDFFNFVKEMHLAKIIGTEKNEIEEFVIGKITNNELKISYPKKNNEVKGDFKNNFVANYSKCINNKKELFTKKFSISKISSDDLMLSPIVFSENINNQLINWSIFKDKANISLNNQNIFSFEIENTKTDFLKSKNTNYENIKLWKIIDIKNNNINYLVIDVTTGKYFYFFENNNGYFKDYVTKIYPKKIQGDEGKVKIKNRNEEIEIDFRKITDNLGLKNDLTPYLKVFGINDLLNKIYLNIEIKKDNEIISRLNLVHELENGLIDKTEIPANIIEFK